RRAHAVRASVRCARGRGCHAPNRASPGWSHPGCGGRLLSRSAAARPRRGHRRWCRSSRTPWWCAAPCRTLAEWRARPAASLGGAPAEMCIVCIIMSTKPPARPAFERPGTVAQDVYDYLRSELMAGRLVAGAWLREQELATALNVSRTPVREAVRRLAQDGLLVIEPNRGVKVHEPDLNEARATYQVRATLEGLAAQLAAERSGPAARTRLEEQLRVMSEAAKDDAVRHIEADNEFHALVAELSGNCVLHEHIERLNLRITRIKIITRHLNPTGFAREQHAGIAGA